MSGMNPFRRFLVNFLGLVEHLDVIEISINNGELNIPLRRPKITHEELTVPLIRPIVVSEAKIIKGATSDIGCFLWSADETIYGENTGPTLNATTAFYPRFPLVRQEGEEDEEGNDQLPGNEHILPSVPLDQLTCFQIGRYYGDEQKNFYPDEGGTFLDNVRDLVWTDFPIEAPVLIRERVPSRTRRGRSLSTEPNLPQPGTYQNRLLYVEMDYRYGRGFEPIVQDPFAYNSGPPFRAVSKAMLMTRSNMDTNVAVCDLRTSPDEEQAYYQRFTRRRPTTVPYESVKRVWCYSEGIAKDNYEGWLQYPPIEESEESDSVDSEGLEEPRRPEGLEET